jgi:hypothetical protein
MQNPHKNNLGIHIKEQGLNNLITMELNKRYPKTIKSLVRFGHQENVQFSSSKTG